MTTDLACLVANALWGFVLTMIEVTGKTRTAGPSWNAGNRETAPAFPAWVNRAGLALSNHKENFPLFLTAVVVVHLAGRADHVTAIASVVYVVARVLHGGIFIAGIKGLRTVAFVVGLVAVFVVLSRLL